MQTQDNIILKYKKEILEILVLIIIFSFGFYIFLNYQHENNLDENRVNDEILKQVKENLNSRIPVSLQGQNSDNSDLMISEIASSSKSKNEKTKDFTEDNLFNILANENEPNFLDKLMKDLVIKNNSTSTIEETCTGQDLLEKDECKKSLFIGCSEALYLNFALVNECLQFSQPDYVKYLKAKRVLVDNAKNGKYKDMEILTSLDKVTVSPIILSREDLKDTVDSSVLNNDFTKQSTELEESERQEVLVDETNMKELEKKSTPVVKEQPKKVLAGLISNMANVMVNYSGWVQGWATYFATNGGRPEAGFKMYKTTAFGFNPYNPNTCIVSLPYKTVDKFFGTQLNYCVKNGILNCIFDHKAKVKAKNIEVIMLKNGKSGVFPLGDLGPAEWTGNALDLNGCAAKKLGATGKDQVRFRVAQ